MNEQIKELFEAAGANENTLAVLKRTTYFDPERFAELIVRKCTNMLPADTIRNEDGVHMFYVIREHFGVPTIGR